MKTKPKLFFRRNYQIIYAIVLILLIPLAITFNTISLVKSFRQNIDVELQRQALLIGQIFNALVKEENLTPENLQNKVLAVGSATQDLYSLNILVPNGEDFKIIASLQSAKIDKVVSDLNNILAWHENQAVTTLTDGSEGEFINTEQRFWEVVIPLTDKSQEKVGLLSLQMSLSAMDDLVKNTLTKSYLILAATVLIVILLLAANTRLFEYAVLFKKLKEVDQMKDEFISMSSHELRSPITSIKGFSSMILEGDYGQLDEKGKKALQIMQASVNRLGNLVEDLLSVSRIEQGRLEIKPEAIKVKEILTSVRDEFSLQAKNKNLELKLNVPDDLPLILAEVDKLKQILINILGNAIKYTKQGSVEISAKLSNKKFVTIDVKDTGIGMTAKDRQRVFSKFYRIKNEATQGVTGTGLGLWIAKQLVELQGGEIYVDSIEHVGTQVYFTLPVYRK